MRTTFSEFLLQVENGETKRGENMRDDETRKNWHFSFYCDSARTSFAHVSDDVRCKCMCVLINTPGSFERVHVEPYMRAATSFGIG